MANKKDSAQTVATALTAADYFRIVKDKTGIPLTQIVGFETLQSYFISDMVSPDVNTEVSITGATTLTSTAFGKWHICSGTSADYTIYLPATSGNSGKYIGVRMSGALTKLVTLDGNASETINGSLTRVMWANESVILKCDGSNWQRVGGRSIPMVCTIRLGSSQTGVVTGTLTKVNVATVDADIGSLADTANKKIIIRRAGKYGISAQIYFANFAAARNICAYYKNGTQLTSSEVSTYGSASSYSVPQVGSQKVTFAAADYIELYCYQDSGSNQAIIGGATGAAALISVEEILDW